MDAATRARQLALLGIEVRATQSQNTGATGGGQTLHEPKGSPKGGQFTAKPSGGGGGYQSILPPASAYKSGGGGGSKKAAAVPVNTPQAPTSPRTMKSGDSGEDVRYAQYAMNLLGFKVAQDGQYGPETEAAVKQIQARLGVAKPNGHLSSSQLHKLQDAVRLSPCVGQAQRDLTFEAQWESRDLEDDVDDVLDEDTEALVVALAEFADDERSFSEALHPRNPKGSAGGGRFRSIVDRIVDALDAWKKGDGPDDPLKDFNREQLLKAGKEHGHTFRRGAPIEEIKAQILDDVRGGAKAEKATAPKLPGAPADHRRFTIQLGGGKAGGTGNAAADAQARAGWKQGDKLTHKNRGEVTYIGPDTADTTGTAGSGSAQWVEFADGNSGMVSADLLSGYVPPSKPSGTATDVGIFAAPSTGKLSLYRESDTGKRQGRAIKSFDDMGQLESWARDNGHTELADYAKAEHARTGGAPAAPALKKGDLVPPGSPIPGDLSGYTAVPKSRVQAGDIAVYRPLGEPPIHGRVVDNGPQRKFIDWEGGRRERLGAGLSSDVTFRRPPADGEPAAKVAKAAPAKVATPAAGNIEARIQGAAKGRDAASVPTVGYVGQPWEKGQISGLHGLSDRKQEKISEAFGAYQTEDFAAVNDTLRGVDPQVVADRHGAAAAAQAPGRVALLDAAFDQASLNRDVVLYRGTGSGRGILGDPATWGDDLTGRTWRDDAYSSSSASPEVASRFTRDNGVRLRVLAPKGTRAVRVASGPDDTELEVVLDRGAQYRVVRDNGWKDIKQATTGQTIRVRDLDVEVATPARQALGPTSAAGSKSPAAILAGLPAGLTPAQQRARLRSRGVPKEQIDTLVPLAPRKAAPKASRALGHDVTPGHDELHHYWTRGEGLAKWVGSPTQFRTLRAHLIKYVTPEQADRMAAAWVHEVTGFWPGSDMHRVLEGGKPRGHRIGRG